MQCQVFKKDNVIFGMKGCLPILKALVLLTGQNSSVQHIVLAPEAKNGAAVVTQYKFGRLDPKRYFSFLLLLEQLQLQAPLMTRQ